MDRFRVRALEKIIDSGRLDTGDRGAAVDVLLSKAEILAAGAEKRGKRERVEEYQALQERYRQTSMNRK